MLLWSLLGYLQSYFLKFWIEEYDDKKDFLTFLGVSVFILVSTILLRMAKSLIYLSGNIKISRRVNLKMLTSLSFASINSFFDRVPIGRILNRFMKDTDVIDIELGVQLDRITLIT